MKNPLKLFGWIFSVVGIGLLLLGAGLTWSNHAALRSSVETQGHVVEMVHTSSDGHDMTSPIFEYELPDGTPVLVASSVSSYPPAYHVGQQVPVLYQPDKPENAVIHDFFSRWMGVLVVGILGIVFAGIGIPLLILQIRKSRREAWVKVHGQRVTARVQAVGLNKSIVMNGRSPFRIEAHWEHPAERKLYLFYSESLWFNPSDYLKETVDVMVNPAQPKIYWMDTSFLPTQA